MSDPRQSWAGSVLHGLFRWRQSTAPGRSRSARPLL